MRTVDFDHRHATVTEMQETRDLALSDPDIVWNEAHGGFWIVSHYDQLSAIARDHARFSSAGGVNYPRPPGLPAYPPIESDAPDHRDFRKMLIPLLTATRVASYEPMVREYVSEILDRKIAAGEPWDVVHELSLPLPAHIATAMFGIAPGEEFDEINDVVFRLNSAAVRGSDEELGKCNEVAEAAFSRGLERARVRELDPLNLFSILVNSTVNGRVTTEQEEIGSATTTITGATGTTSEAIGFIVYQLAMRPELLDRLAANSDLVDALVEEVLRVDAPVWHLFRTVTEEVSIGGVTMQPGDKVMLAFGFANYDEQRFADPAEIDLDTKRPTHLSFSAGVHRCIGLHSARLQLRIITEELVKRVARIELAKTPPPPRNHFSTRGFDELLVVLQPR